MRIETFTRSGPWIALGLLCAGAGLLMAAETRPALLEAAKNRDKASIQRLLQQKGEVNAADADGTTPLHWAAHNDDPALVDALVAAGAKVNAITDLGVTPLWLASENGNSVIVRRLLTAGANPNLALESGESALMVASRGGYSEVAEQLLAKGANPNAHGTRGQTALMWAISQSHPDMVKVLLTHKVDIQAKSEVWSEVMAIEPHGYLPYNKNIPHGGETALMFAARVGDLDSTKLLVAAGANVNDADAWGVSAVTLAEHSGFSEVALYLLEKGANASAMDAGFSALHEAIMRRDEKVIASLLDHGADPNATLKTWTPMRRSSDDWNFDAAIVGASPLWLAARYTEGNVMRMLLKKGADPKFVHHAHYVASANFGQQEKEEQTTILMAATGLGKADHAWAGDLPAAQREAAALDAVKVAVEAGVDLNAAGLDKKTALDGAQTSRFPSVTAYLTEKGAKASGTGGGGGRGGPRPAK
ncbi:MAG: ankyrin repeat domain-containing protein [Acidobacteriota bacterium]